MTFAALCHTGEIQHFDDGRLILQGRPLAIFRWIDSQLEAMASHAGAQGMQVPAIIDRQVLERAGFFEAFGETATRVHDAAGADAHRLSPALCYHAYAGLADQTIEAPVLLTTIGKCFRRETLQRSPTRLWEFTMREVIFIGAADWVADERRQWMERVAGFARSIDLVSTMELATDPFFVAEARGKKLMQQLKELKYELRMQVHSEETAIASMNLHETFFGARFNLSLPDGSTASSGCVAFGVERWTMAMIAQLGIDRAVEIAVLGKG